MGRSAKAFVERSVSLPKWHPALRLSVGIHNLERCGSAPPWWGQWWGQTDLSGIKPKAKLFTASHYEAAADYHPVKFARFLRAVVSRRCGSASEGGAMSDQFPIFEVLLKRRGRRWSWSVSTTEGALVVMGSRSSRWAASYEANRALFLLLSAPYRLRRNDPDLREAIRIRRSRENQS